MMNNYQYNLDGIVYLFSSLEELKRFIILSTF